MPYTVQDLKNIEEQIKKANKLLQKIKRVSLEMDITLKNKKK
jgi:hypothetical protein